MLFESDFLKAHMDRFDVSMLAGICAKLWSWGRLAGRGLLALRLRLMMCRVLPV